MGGGSQACTSSRPRCQASRSAAACSASSHCQRSRGVPARGSSNKYASAVSRKKAAPTIGPLTAVLLLSAEFTDSESCPCSGAECCAATGEEDFCASTTLV